MTLPDLRTLSCAQDKRLSGGCIAQLRPHQADMLRCCHADAAARRLSALLASALLATSGASAQSQTRVATDTPAADVIGQLDTHARAISCSNGGWFTSVKYVEDAGRIASVELCCGNERGTSVVWYEGGGSQLEEPCFSIGVPVEDGGAAGAYLTHLYAFALCLDSCNRIFTS